MAQSDLLLELVMLISAIALDGAACDLIATSNIVGLLYQLWKEKSEDTEILLQLITCFHRFFLRDSTREEAMYSTRIVVDMLECLSHRNAAVRRAADAATELVLELDRKEDTGELGQLGLQIRKKRFEGFNAQWLSGVGGSGGSGAGGGGGTGRHKGGGMGNDGDHQDDEYTGMSMSHIQSKAVLGHGGRVDWHSLMSQKERLALDMDELDNDSSGDGESWEESGGDWA